MLCIEPEQPRKMNGQKDWTKRTELISRRKIVTCPCSNTPVSSMTPIINRASLGGNWIRALESRLWKRSLYTATNKLLKNGSTVSGRPPSDSPTYEMPVLAADVICWTARLSLTNISGGETDYLQLSALPAEVQFTSNRTTRWDTPSNRHKPGTWSALMSYITHPSPKLQCDAIELWYDHWDIGISNKVHQDDGAPRKKGDS